MKLKGILTFICSLLGASIIGIPMIESNRELINNYSDKTKTSNEEIKESVSVNPTSIEIDGRSIINSVVKSINRYAIYSIIALPSDADTSVTWSLENNDQPDKIYIGTNGTLGWEVDLGFGTYNFTIKATSTVDTTISATKDVTLILKDRPASVEIIGSDTLNGTMGTAGSSSYSASVLPNTAAQGVSWSLENNTQGNKISIDQNGKLSWTNTLTVGTYNFTVKVSADYHNMDLESIGATKDVILTIDGPTGIEITGSDTLNGTMGTAGRSSYSASVLPNNVNQSVTWSLENNTQGNKIIILKSSGLLRWGSDLAAGTYNFTIKATSTIDGTISATKDVTLTISYANPTSIQITGSDTLNGTMGTTGSSSYTASVLPNNADSNVTWSLENNTQRDKISINQSGVLSWTDTLSAGTYNFTIKATSTALSTVSATKNVTLTIAYANPILGNITLTGNGVSGNNINLTYNQSTNITASCNITNEANVDPSLTKSWSLNNAPSGSSINNNGQLTIPTTQILNNVSFSIIYQVGTIRQTLSATLTISYANPTSIQITGSDTLNGTMGTTGSSSYSASVLPNNADQSVTWSLENNTQGNKILINQSGQLSWTDTLSVGTYNFTIKATSTALATVSTTKDVTLTINRVSPTNIQITGSDTLNGTMGTTGSSSYSASVLPNNADQSVTWSLENNTQGNKILINQSGQLSWTDTLNAGTYNFTIKATSAALSTVSATKNVTLTIAYATPQLGNITLTGDDVSSNNINLTYNQSANITASCSITNEANIDPNLAKSWSLNNAPSGVSINSNGQLTIPTTQTLNNVSFSIIYQVGTVRQTLSVNLTISYANPILGDITLTKASGDATITGNIINQVYGNASTFNASCNITNNGNIDPSLAKTWSLNNAPSGVSINASSGLITFSNGTAKVSNHAFSVTYTVGTITKTQNYTLNVGYATPIFSDITLQGTGVVDNNNINLSLNQAATINASCNVTNPNNIDPSLTKSWTMQNQPAGVTINSNTGAISIPNNLTIGNYTFTLTYQCGTDSKQSTITLSIGYETPILSNITLSSANNVIIQGSNVSLDYHTSGSFQATCDVTNQPNINPSLTKTWSLANAPSGMSINNNGLVTIASDMNKVTNQAITINCNIGGISKTLIFRLTINYQQPQLDGQITLMHEGIALNGNLNLTYQTQADIQASCQINNPNNIDPNLNKTWSLQNAPSGVSINNNGMIHVANNLNIGTYAINVIYQVGSQSSTTTFNLNIEYAMVNTITISGSQSLQGFQNTAGSSNYQASINPLNANPNVTWSLNNASSSISIDNQGVLTWNALLPGTYNFSIIATSVTDPSISQSYDVSLYIQEAPAPVSKTTDSIYAIVWGTSAGVLAIGLISIIAYQIHKHKATKLLD